MRTIGTIIRRHLWELGILAAVLFGACSETTLDPDTATATRRPKDTLVSHDTTEHRDTTISLDTIITTSHDTLIKSDTMIRVQKVIRTVIVTVRDSITVHDTVVQRDTLVRNDTTHQFDTVTIRDTMRLRDTVRLRDTTRIIDTLLIHDTIVVVDTLKEVSSELKRFGMLFKKLDAGRKDSVEVVIDDLTRLFLDLKPGVGPVSMQLRLIARVTHSYDTGAWGFPPSWFFLLIPKTSLSGGRALRQLVADPRVNTSDPGLAIVPRYPLNQAWIPTKSPGSGDNVFAVTSIDTAGRWVYGYIKAHLEQGVTIDSLALKMAY